MSKMALRELYLDELRDLYDAENRLVKALPKLAKEAESENLSAGIEEHLEQTKGHVDRLREIFEAMDEKPGGKRCAAMVGLIQEGEEMMDEDFEPGVKDAALISAAQRVEHYEIAAYGCVRTWAGLLGEREAENLLQQTLDEEKEADRKLTDLSQQINVEAVSSAGEKSAMQEEDEAQVPRPRAKSRSAKA
jgi:ferritin-like metal-binding protein YciE